MKHPLKSTLQAVLIINILIAIIFVIGIFNSQNKSVEYKIEYIADSDYLIKLRHLGLKKWQVVGSRRASNDNNYGYELILMRKK